MFWCRDIGLAKRLLGYSVWLLGSGLAASNHDTPKASCQCEWYKPTPTPLWHSEWKIFLCEFWLLRWSTMVARAWPVCVEVIQDWLLLAPSQTSPPSCFMTLLSWDIPLISFNGVYGDVLLRCSKWLLGAWLDSFTMILDADWSSESMSPPPCLYDTVIQSYVQLKSGSIERTAISWAVLHHWKSMGQILVPSCPPGVQLLPHFEVWSYRACQPLQMWQISHFCEIHSLSYEASKVFRMQSQWGNFGTLLPPRGATFTPFWGMVLQSLPASWMWQISHFCEIHSLSYEASKFFSMLSLCVFFCPYFAPGANIVPRSLIKVIAHDSRLGRHVLTPHSWLCDKNCGRSSAPK